MSKYYGVIGNRDYIKFDGKRLPFWLFLDEQPDGWLTSLAYQREDLPDFKPMIFDCGAWTYRLMDVPMLRGHQVTAGFVFGEYQKVAKPFDLLIAPDHMLIPGVDFEARRKFNRENADRFLEVCSDTRFIPMATVHGETQLERIETAQLYAEMGYTALALGGLAARASQKTLVMKAVGTVRTAVPGVWLHVLGLSSPEYAMTWTAMGVQSYDGSSHFKQAFTAGTFFTADGMRLVKHQAARPGEQITAPKCECRACSQLRTRGIDTRSYGSNEHNMGRAAHNLNMLMRAQREATEIGKYFTYGDI